MAESILINGKIHDWTDVKVFVMGAEFTGIVSIDWSAKKEKELQYAAGTNPAGIGYGHRSYDCNFSMTLEAAEKFELAAHAAGKDALDYAPLLISIAYADKTVGASGIIDKQFGIMHSIQIMDADITEISESLDEGTKKIVRKYTAVAGKIIAVP